MVLLARIMTVTHMFAVYADGSICLDILQNRWAPTYDVAAILTSIQVSAASNRRLNNPPPSCSRCLMSPILTRRRIRSPHNCIKRIDANTKSASCKLWNNRGCHSPRTTVRQKRSRTAPPATTPHRIRRYVCAHACVSTRCAQTEASSSAVPMETGDAPSASGAPV